MHGLVPNDWVKCAFCGREAAFNKRTGKCSVISCEAYPNTEPTS